MIGEAGDIKQWLQIAQAPSTLLGGPLALTALATMMQQRAMQQQMDEIVEYLKEIGEKVDDVLRGQKDAVLADMIGVDLVIEEALAVRERVGRVSEVIWSKVQMGSALARTQAYALRQLDAIAEKLEKKADVGEIARATRRAEPQVREWLAVLARTFQLQDGIWVLELDRVLDASPEELDNHRLGLIAAREHRVHLIGRSTERMLEQMAATVDKANSKVLFNPFDSPSAVKSSNQVTAGVLEFRDRLGIGSGNGTGEGRRWRQAAAELRDRVVGSAVDGVSAAGRFGSDTLDRATRPFRAVDIDGDGVPDKSRAAAAATRAGDAIKGAATGAVGRAGRLFRRKPTQDTAVDGPDPDTTAGNS
ncbi:hypothetical protein FOJ82_05095 [Tessaracoccus rhinocerotis]|uniref:Uncharacterized protein n=1 Tax=Tessaracoccus rhinocerotis TaxID=1689449 RepID=A0A553K6A4_9ACTN|nr:hypothetical protein [Tessaracoccus rhinocerotis]TRY20240.1 hypothetical protein FOJ82_05095 [Tessaracoccus rhinocerotis]